DENGKSRIPPPEPWANQMASSEGNVFELHSVLSRAAEEGRIVSVKGMVRVKLLSTAKTVEIEGIAKAGNVQRVIGDRRFLVNVMNPAPGDYIVTVVAFQNATKTLDIDHIKAELVDASGKKLGSAGYASGGGDTQREVASQWYFQQNNVSGPAAKVVLEYP